MPASNEKIKLTIEFDNQVALMHFASWLCGSGEQDYWMWQECREYEEPEGDITAVEFHYHIEDETKDFEDDNRYSEFMFSCQENHHACRGG
jgi:hypothetical protein